MKRAAVIWVNFGPYHLARLRALSVAFEVHGIELAATQRLYGWTTDKSDGGLRIHTLCNGAWETRSSLQLVLRTWYTLNSVSPDVVIVAGYSHLPEISAAVWGALKRRTTVLLSESTYSDFRRSWWKETLKRRLVRLLYNRAVVGGRRACHYISSLGIPPSRVLDGYDVVDNSFFSDGVRALRLSSRIAHGLPSKYFLFVGRLAPEKNVPWLLNAFESYSKKGGTWHLVLVGQGPEYNALIRIASSLSSQDQIHFVGFKSATELLPFFAFAGALVLPSLREPWGLVVNEAMASSVPVLVSNRCGCCDDLVDEGENGFVFDPADGDHMVRLMLAMSALSEAERAAMGRQSASIIEKYSPETFARNVVRAAAL